MTIGLHISSRAIELAAGNAPEGKAADDLRLELDRDVQDCGPEELKTAFAGIVAGLGGARAPGDCRVALADPLAAVHVFALQEQPGSREQARRMAAWMAGRDLGLCRDMAFDVQPLERSESGPELLLAVGVEQRLLERINRAALGVNLRPRVMNPTSFFRFNRLHDALPEAQSGMLISLEQHYWSLLLWDERKRIRLAKSKWLSMPCTAAGVRSISEEWRRQMMAIAAGSGREIGTLHVHVHAAGLRDPVREALLDLLGQEAATRLCMEAETLSPARCALVP